MDLSEEERIRRARAALGYSLLDQKDLANRLSVSPKTFAGYLGRTRNGPDDMLLLRIADECGVPRWFMEFGWAAPSSEADELQDRVRRLEAQVAALLAATTEPSAGGSAATDRLP